MAQYPQCLIEELAKYGRQPTGNKDWDAAVLSVLRKNEREKDAPWLTLHQCALNLRRESEKARAQAYNLADPNVYSAHSSFLVYIANSVVLAPQRRKFIVDDDNRQVLRFLLYYFNDCPLAEEVFPERGYKLHKNLLIQGGVGVGKTLLMQIFSEYLRRTNNPRFFHNVSVTQMVNYYTIHNNLDRFTYFEEESKGFQCKPENVCLNDIGIQDRTFFGMDTGLLTDEFLRNHDLIVRGHIHEHVIVAVLVGILEGAVVYGLEFHLHAGVEGLVNDLARKHVLDGGAHESGSLARLDVLELNDLPQLAVEIQNRAVLDVIGSLCHVYSPILQLLEAKQKMPCPLCHNELTANRRDSFRLRHSNDTLTRRCREPLIGRLTAPALSPGRIRRYPRCETLLRSSWCEPAHR